MLLKDNIKINNSKIKIIKPDWIDKI